MSLVNTFAAASAPLVSFEGNLEAFCAIKIDKKNCASTICEEVANAVNGKECSKDIKAVKLSEIVDEVILNNFIVNMTDDELKSFEKHKEFKKDGANKVEKVTGPARALLKKVREGMPQSLPQRAVMKSFTASRNVFTLKKDALEKSKLKAEDKLETLDKEVPKAVKSLVGKADLKLTETEIDFVLKQTALTKDSTIDQALEALTYDFYSQLPDVDATAFASSNAGYNAAVKHIFDGVTEAEFPAFDAVVKKLNASFDGSKCIVAGLSYNQRKKNVEDAKAKVTEAKSALPSEEEVKKNDEQYAPMKDAVEKAKAQKEADEARYSTLVGEEAKLKEKETKAKESLTETQAAITSTATDLQKKETELNTKKGQKEEIEALVTAEKNTAAAVTEQTTTVNNNNSAVTLASEKATAASQEQKNWDEKLFTKDASEEDKAKAIELERSLAKAEKPKDKTDLEKQIADLKVYNDNVDSAMRTSTLKAHDDKIAADEALKIAQTTLAESQKDLETKTKAHEDAKAKVPADAESQIEKLETDITTLTAEVDHLNKNLTVLKETEKQHQAIYDDAAKATTEASGETAKAKTALDNSTAEYNKVADNAVVKTHDEYEAKAKASKDAEKALEEAEAALAAVKVIPEEKERDTPINEKKRECLDEIDLSSGFLTKHVENVNLVIKNINDSMVEKKTQRRLAETDVTAKQFKEDLKKAVAATTTAFDEATGKTSESDGNALPWILGGVGVAAVLGGVGYAVYARKKKSTEDPLLSRV